MRLTRWSVALVATVVAGPLAAQQVPSDVVEVPLRVEDGRLLVTVLDDRGRDHDFVLGLGMTFVTESGVDRIGGGLGSLTLEGIPVQTDQAQTVPDSFLEGADAAGILGGATLSRFDILIDAPAGRLLLKPVGRAVRWDGVALSNPVALQVFHDVLLRADADFGGHLVGGLLDLVEPHLQVNEPLASAVDGDVVSRFRMGYGTWADLPAIVTDSQTLRGWDRANEGFVVLGAAIAYDCAIAISWAHAELRTCLG